MKKKILIICAALLAASTLLTGCKVPEKTTKTDKTKVEDVKKTDADKQVVMKVNGNPVSYAEFRHYFMTYKNRYDNGDDTFWAKNPDALTSYKKEIVGLLSMNRVIEEMAKKEKIKLTAEEKKTKIDDAYDEQVKKGQAELDKQYLTKDVLLYTLNLYALYEKLNNTYNEGKGTLVKVSEDEAVKYAKDNDYIMAKHVLINAKDLSDEEKAKKRASAEEVLKKAKNGDDFDALIKQYGEDPGMQSNPNGYVFKKGDMVAEFETAAYALKEGDISDIVETTYGFHIIKRLPLDEKTVTESVKKNLVLDNFDKYVQAQIKEAKVEYTDQKAFDKYDFTTLK